MSLPRILDAGYLPALLRDHPVAVVPYLVSRDEFIARLYHQRTGYWQPDGQGLDPRSQEERAAALDLLAGGKADAFAYAAANLADQGDLALALDIVPGPAPPSRQQRASGTAAGSPGPADGAAPAVGSVRFPGLRGAGWR
jgi:hypothetical protein